MEVRCPTGLKENNFISSVSRSSHSISFFFSVPFTLLSLLFHWPCFLNFGLYLLLNSSFLNALIYLYSIFFFFSHAIMFVFLIVHILHNLSFCLLINKYIQILRRKLMSVHHLGSVYVVAFLFSFHFLSLTPPLSFFMLFVSPLLSACMPACLCLYVCLSFLPLLYSPSLPPSLNLFSILSLLSFNSTKSLVLPIVITELIIIIFYNQHDHHHYYDN